MKNLVSVRQRQRMLEVVAPSFPVLAGGMTRVVLFVRNSWF